MEFLIAGYYTITYGLTSTGGEVISNYTAYFALIVTCILMPLAILFIIVQRRRDLHRYRIYNVLGELYAGFKTSDRINLTYYLLFGIRRVMYIYVVFNWVEDSWAQAMVIMFMNLFMLIFVGQQKPLSRMFKNRIELFNEFCVLIITIHMICFTEWVPGRQERDVMGWSMIAIIGFNIAINVKSIFKVIYHGFKLVCIRYKNHAKAYFKKQVDKKFLPFLVASEDKDSGVGTLFDPHGNFNKTGAQLTKFNIPFDPLKRLPKAAEVKLDVIPEDS